MSPPGAKRKSSNFFYFSDASTTNSKERGRFIASFLFLLRGIFLVFCTLVEMVWVGFEPVTMEWIVSGPSLSRGLPIILLFSV